MSYPCAVETQPAQPVVCIRMRAAIQDLGQAIGGAYEEIDAFLARHNVMPAGAPYVTYYNADMQNLDVEAGFPVATPLAGEGRVQYRVLPECRVATCLYKGPYDQVGAAYGVLQPWMTQQRLTPGPQMYEWYLNDPAQVRPDELLTKIAWVLV